MSFDPLPPELLADWLAASDDAARKAVLDDQAAALGGREAAALLELLSAGPSYGGDRVREAALMRRLLELALGIAEKSGAWLEAARACHQLAHVLAGGVRRIWLERAARHAIAGQAWELVARIEGDLAVEAVVARQPREAIAARVRALAACRHDPADRLLAELGDEAAFALIETVMRLGNPRAAWDPLRDWLAHARKCGDLEAIARACERLGTLAGQLGLTADADHWLGEAAAIHGELLDEPALARTLLRRMAIAVAAGDMAHLAQRAGDLLALRSRTLDPAVQALIDDAGASEF